MKHTLTRVETAPVITVHLELTVEEFAGLKALHTHYGGGSPDGLRGRIEGCLDEVGEELGPEFWTRLARAQADSGYAYDRVEKAFA